MVLKYWNAGLSNYGLTVLCHFLWSVARCLFIVRVEWKIVTRFEGGVPGVR